MGHYCVWIMTGLDNRAHSVAQAQMAAETLIQPYDEENDIPGEWPGLGFDYYSPDIPVHAAGFLLEEAAPDSLPHVGVTAADGLQERLDPEDETGVIERLRQIIRDPGELVAVINWHA